MNDLFSFDDVLTVTATGRVLVVAWLFLMGGILGSFMNVVVYRVPLAMSLSRPGSRCPECLHAIRWYDNVPIFGWLWLHGRCRDCDAPISVRYPLVELLVAATSAALAWSTCLEPLPASPEMADAASTYAVRLGLWAFQMLLVCTLCCAALMELDGHFAPPRMLA